MTRDDIIKLARQSGLAPEWMPSIAHPQMQHLERFAALVAAAEREACANLCDDQVPLDYDPIQTLINCADAIRARGQA